MTKNSLNLGMGQMLMEEKLTICHRKAWVNFPDRDALRKYEIAVEYFKREGFYTEAHERFIEIYKEVLRRECG